jgi:hypothetical protein
MFPDPGNGSNRHKTQELGIPCQWPSQFAVLSSPFAKPCPLRCWTGPGSEKDSFGACYQWEWRLKLQLKTRASSARRHWSPYMFERMSLPFQFGKGQFCFLRNNVSFLLKINWREECTVLSPGIKGAKHAAVAQTLPSANASALELHPYLLQMKPTS